MFPIRCATVEELRLQQMGDFYEKPQLTMEKGTPLRQIWSNKSIDACGSDVVTLYGGEKKSTQVSPMETRCRL